MARDELTVKVDGLADLRKSLRAVDRGALKEVQQVTKSAAEIVAAEARSLAPRRTGRLSSSIRATTSGNKGIVRSPLPYAAVHEWGGSIRPRGTPIQIKRSAFVSRALDHKYEAVVRRLAEGLDDVFVRNGWR